MFNKYSLFRSIAVIALIPTLAFSATAAGKVRSAMGDVDRQRVRQNDWSTLRVGANIYQSDKVRTGVASEVIFGLSDGSSISIAENAEVDLAQLIEPNGKGGFETQINIKKGHINFAVHKLQQKNSKFIFKTGTATASIRGTEGSIGGEGVFFAGLKTGKLEIKPEGSNQAVSIVAGETTFGKDSLVVLKLASSGHPKFANKLEKLLSDHSKKMDELIADVQKADSVFQQEMKAESQNMVSNIPDNGFIVTSASPAEVCEQGLIIEGFYRASDVNASLVISMGNSYQSSNLVKAADGVAHSFAQKISVTDENGLWSEDKATLSFVGGGKTSTQTIDVSVNKACSDVNRKAPSIVLSHYDSLRCVANISIGDMQNDGGIFSMDMDGTPGAEDVVTHNVQKRFKLRPGIHEYSVKVEDLAGNKNEETKTMGCFPLKNFKVDVQGASREILRVPPPPKGMADRVMQTLVFSIRSPENNPNFLHKVTVKQNGKIILQETLAQIQGLDYQIPVELYRGAANRIEVEVIHKSGFKAKAKKVYEVN